MMHSSSCAGMVSSSKVSVVFRHYPRALQTYCGWLVSDGAAVYTLGWQSADHARLISNVQTTLSGFGNRFAQRGNLPAAHADDGQASHRLDSSDWVPAVPHMIANRTPFQPSISGKLVRFPVVMFEHYHGSSRQISSQSIRLTQKGDMYKDITLFSSHNAFQRIEASISTKDVQQTRGGRHKLGAILMCELMDSNG